MAMNDAEAFHTMGGTYSLGSSGLPQDSSKAVQLLLKATI